MEKEGDNENHAMARLVRRKYLKHITATFLLGTGIVALLTIQRFSQVKLFILMHLAAVALGFLSYGMCVGSRTRSVINGPRNSSWGSHRNHPFYVLFTSLFAGLILTLHFSTFYRVFGYHVLSAALAGLLVYQIVAFDRNRKGAAYIAMAQIVLYAFVNKTSVYLLNLSPAWYDGVFHYDNSLRVVESGTTVPQLGPYLAFPGHHIRNGVLLLVTAMAPELYSVIINLIPLLIPISVFLIGRVVTDDVRWPLLAALLSSVTVYLNMPFVSPHMTAFPLVLLASYLVIRTHKLGHHSKTTGLMFLIGFGALLDHPGSGAFVLVLILISDAIVRLYGRRRVRQHFLAYAVLALGYVMYLSGPTFDTFVTQLFLPTPGTPPYAPTRPDVSAAYIAELLFSYASFALYTFLFVIGALIVLSRAWSRQLQLVALIPIILVAPNILQYAAGRPIPQFLTLAQYPVYMALLMPTVATLSRNRKMLVLLVAVVVISQFSLTLRNDDNVYLLKNETPQFATYAGPWTIKLRAFIEMIPSNASLRMDYASGSAHWGTRNFDENGPAAIISIANYADSNAFIIYDPELILRWQAVASDPKALVDDVSHHLEHGGVDLIYDNGRVVVFLNTKVP